MAPLPLTCDKLVPVNSFILPSGTKTFIQQSFLPTNNEQLASTLPWSLERGVAANQCPLETLAQTADQAHRPKLSLK